jgi:hypothetical protein
VPLVDMTWRQITIHHVIAAFLHAERNTRFNRYQPWLSLIDTPNLTDPLENHKRLRLLYFFRAKFMVEVPTDTAWYEVAFLSENDTNALYLSARHNPKWDAEGNRLDLVAQAVKEPITANPTDWARVILWGHDKTGPFTILEGSHRMLGYAYATPRPPLNIAVYVGLSPSYCFWHSFDPAFYIANDLWACGAPEFVERDGWIWRTRQYCPRTN